MPPDAFSTQLSRRLDAAELSFVQRDFAASKKGSLEVIRDLATLCSSSRSLRTSHHKCENGCPCEAAIALLLQSLYELKEHEESRNIISTYYSNAGELSELLALLWARYLLHIQSHTEVIEVQMLWWRRKFDSLSTSTVQTAAQAPPSATLSASSAMEVRRWSHIDIVWLCDWWSTALQALQHDSARASEVYVHLQTFLSTRKQIMSISNASSPKSVLDSQLEVWISVSFLTHTPSLKSIASQIRQLIPQTPIVPPTPVHSAPVVPAPIIHQPSPMLPLSPSPRPGLTITIKRADLLRALGLLILVFLAWRRIRRWQGTAAQGVAQFSASAMSRSTLSSLLTSLIGRFWMM